MTIQEKIISYLMSDDAPCLCGLDEAKEIANTIVKFFEAIKYPHGDSNQIYNSSGCYYDQMHDCFVNQMGDRYQRT